MIMSKFVLEVKNLSKIYNYGSINYSTLVEDFSETIKNLTKKKKTFLNQDSKKKIFFSDKKKIKSFYALKNVNFELKKGDALAILGKNGSGKTTLIKCISKIAYPSEGVIQVNGKVAPIFLNIGNLINPEMTGLENIYFLGAMYGMNKEEIGNKIKDIIEFSELAEFMNTPVKRYSTGMNSRLAFSIIIHLDVDIFLADEILSVGDQNFKKKSITKLKSLIKDYGKSLILVSHEKALVQEICHKAIILDQ